MHDGIFKIRKPWTINFLRHGLLPSADDTDTVRACCRDVVHASSMEAFPSKYVGQQILYGCREQELARLWNGQQRNRVSNWSVISQYQVQPGQAKSDNRKHLQKVSPRITNGGNSMPSSDSYSNNGSNRLPTLYLQTLIAWSRPKRGRQSICIDKQELRIPQGKCGDNPTDMLKRAVKLISLRPILEPGLWSEEALEILYKQPEPLFQRTRIKARNEAVKSLAQ